jgi:hypothetical protein
MLKRYQAKRTIIFLLQKQNSVPSILHNNIDQNSLQNVILQLCNEHQQLILEKVKRSPEILLCKV